MSAHTRPRLAAPLLIAIGLGSIAATASAAQAESRDHAIWRELVHANPAPAAGCYHATYPSTVWVRDQCHRSPYHAVTPPLLARRAHPLASNHRANVGDGYDYALAVKGTISQTIGSFPVVAGVKWEYSNGGIAGPDEYTLQINSQFQPNAPACNGIAGCLAWEQFVYTTDWAVQGSAAVNIWYFLIGYTASGASCPNGWYDDGGGDCYAFSDYVTAPDVPITQLGGEKLSGSAQVGGNDTVVFTSGNTAYAISAADSAIGLGSWWNESEFNVLGADNLSTAVFNPGVFVMTRVAVKATSTAKPTCLGNAGTTGESSNFNLGPCAAYSAPMPFIRFSQSN